jgi:hypothetical protein
MPLFQPPAYNLKSLVGGYNSNADYETLADDQTNDARNAELTRINTVKKRNGYNRRLNTALTKTGLKSDTGLDGDKVRGHYQLNKAGFNGRVKINVVAAGQNLWKYTSQTASIILSGITDSDDAYWQFEQIQDPRPSASGSDDIIVGVNGNDPPVIWNGTENSATFLSSVTGSSGVQVAKHIASLKGRIYLGNIKDSNDVDSQSKYIMSGFFDGSPTPHIFPPDLVIYAGGSDRYGQITGLVALNGLLIIFKRNTIYTMNPGGGTSVSTDLDALSLVHQFSQEQLDENIGCIAPSSIATIGNSVIFLSEHGVFSFDGKKLIYIGQAIEQDLKQINYNRKKLAAGVFYRAKNQYWLSLASDGSSFNDMVFVYDVTYNKWYPPYDGMRGDILSNFELSDKDRILSGDHLGYIYELDNGTADGKNVGLNFSPTTISNSSTVLNIADSQSLDTSGDGYLGVNVLANDAVGTDGEHRIITDATATQITVSPGFKSVTTATVFSIGGIRNHFKTKDFSFDSPDMDKLYRELGVRFKQYGDINVKTNYIIDFNELSNAGTATISQYNSNFLTWTGGDFATGSNPTYSGTIETVSVGACSISVSAGTDLSASNLSDYCVYLWNSGTRYVRPISSGECNTLNIGDYGTASLVSVNSNTSYFINTNLENTWDNSKWGPGKTKIKKVSLRFMDYQNLVGQYFSLRFYNERANEPYEIYGFDIKAKPIGRR